MISSDKKADNLTKDSIEQSINRFDSLSLLEFFSLLVHQKRIIISITSAFIFLSVAYAFLATSTYKSQLLMVPTEQPNVSASPLSSQMSGLASLAGISVSSGSGPSKSSTALAILSSRSFAEEFIKKNKLMTILNHEEWNKETRSWKNGEPSMLATSKAFQGLLEIIEDRKTSIITFSIEWTDPKQASDWLNDSIDFLNLYIRTQTLRETEMNLQYLENELQEKTSNNSQSILYSLIAEEQSKAMMANVRTEYSMKIIDRAVPPEKKFKPQRLLVLVIGTLIGFTLSLITVLVLDIYKASRIK